MDDIQIKSWEEAKDLAYPIRYTVFVREQGVPEELELDEEDPSAWHAVLSVDGVTVGTGRLTASGKIGRLAVLEKYRKRAYGTKLIRSLMNHGLANGIAHFYLHAQISAQSFYENLGFKANGPEFIEAGIVHIRMESL